MKAQDFKYLFLTLIFILVGVGFVKNIEELKLKGGRPTALGAEIIALEQSRDVLLEELAFRKSDEYVEIKARDSLNMVKPNERVFVIDPAFLSAELKQDFSAEASDDSSLETAHFNDPNVSPLYKWFKLVF